MLKGLMLSNAMLSMEKDPSSFEFAMSILEQYDVQVIEYYTKDPQLAERYGKYISDRGYVNIFHSALDQKRSGWCRLCDEEESGRLASLDFTKRSIEKAVNAGAVKTVLQSGKMPIDHGCEDRCIEAFIKSMHELVTFVGGEIELGIEPCDRSLDICQLIGPALETFTFMKRLNEPAVSLTMDTAHSALTLEDPFEAVKLCKPYSSHVHLASCILSRESSLFGDKHPLFTNPESFISDDSAKKLFNNICELYGDEQFIISTEMICRMEDEKAYFIQMLDSMPWFFTKKG